MNHFLHVLKPLWILLTYQQFLLKLVLLIDSGCTHSNFKYLNQTYGKIRDHFLSTLLFTEPLICFPVSSEPGEGKDQEHHIFLAC